MICSKRRNDQTEPNLTETDRNLTLALNLAVTQPQPFLYPTVWQSNSPQISDKFLTRISPISTTLAIIITIKSAKFEAQSV